MHLALVINSLGIGGAERVLIRLADAWAKAGHKISFITFFQEDKFFYELNKENNNISLFNLGENKPLSTDNNIVKVLGTFFKIIKRIYLLRKLFNQLKPDVIVSFLVGANISVLFANAGSNLPVIVSERIDPVKHVIPWFYKKLRLYTYNLAAAIVVQTKGIADYFPSEWRKKIFIIPNSVKKPETTINVKNYSYVGIENIVSVGRLDPQKDHKTLIYAFAKVASSKPKLKLTIYGDGPLRGFLDKLIKSLNLEDRVFLPGISMDIAKILQNADMFVFPSLYEGFSNALCEAMSFGLPVIASDYAGNIDVVRHGINGLLFPSGNVEELIILLNQLINNPEQCNILANNAKEVVNIFNELEILKLWDNVLEFAYSNTPIYSLGTRT